MINPDLEKFLNKIPKETEVFVDLYADIVERIQDLLEAKGHTQKELAKKLDKKPSEISKWLNGKHNLTLKTIAKLQVALEEEIINVPTKKTFVSKSTKDYNFKTSFTVFKNNSKRPVLKDEIELVSTVRISA